MKAEMTGQKIKSLYIKNAQVITEVSFDPNETGSIIVAGKNATGKTTLMRCIFAAMGGKAPEVRKGQRKGEVKLELDDYSVSLSFSEKSDKIVVTRKDKPGIPIRGPKAHLKSILGKRAFDATAFLHGTAKSQADALLAIIDIPGNKNDLEKITGNKVILSDGKITEQVNQAYQAI